MCAKFKQAWDHYISEESQREFSKQLANRLIELTQQKLNNLTDYTPYEEINNSFTQDQYEILLDVLSEFIFNLINSRETL